MYPPSPLLSTSPMAVELPSVARATTAVPAGGLPPPGTVIVPDATAPVCSEMLSVLVAGALTVTVVAAEGISPNLKSTPDSRTYAY